MPWLSVFSIFTKHFICAQYCFMVTVEQSQQYLVLIFLCWFGFACVFVVHYWMYLGLCAWRPEDSVQCHASEAIYLVGPTHIWIGLLVHKTWTNYVRIPFLFKPMILWRRQTLHNNNMLALHTSYKYIEGKTGQNMFVWEKPFVLFQKYGQKC